MSSKGRGRKRRPPSGESFINDLHQEVDESMANESAVLEAFNQLSSLQMTNDSILSLPSKVLSVYLVAKYDPRVISFVTFALPELAVLPLSLRWEMMEKSTGLSDSEVSINPLIVYLFNYTNTIPVKHVSLCCPIQPPIICFSILFAL